MTERDVHENGYGNGGIGIGVEVNSGRFQKKTERYTNKLTEPDYAYNIVTRHVCATSRQSTASDCGCMHTFVETGDNPKSDKTTCQLSFLQRTCGVGIDAHT